MYKRQVLALASLSNNLLLTMASARRVLQLLDEKEEVKDISGKAAVINGDIEVRDLSFAYEDEAVPVSYTHLDVYKRQPPIRYN